MKRIYKGLLVLALVISFIIPIHALDNGAYLTGRSTSYVSPFTGNTVDGGTNIALGDSMISSMVENTMLIEVVDGHIYATIGIGLQSNISNVRFTLMNSDGSSYAVNSTITGSSYNNGDNVSHYRIELASLSQWISPIIYIGPMGRDVQFFIQSDSNLTSGTGIYTSQMVPALPATQDNTTSSAEETPAVQQNQSTETTQETHLEQTPKESQEMVSHAYTKEELFDGVIGLTYHKIEAKQSSNGTMFFVVGGICLVILIGGSIYVKKKNKK